MAKIRAINIHVMPHNRGWAVKSEGARRRQSVHNTQREAVDVARKIARTEKGVLLIHRRDGRIRKRERYGPLPPRLPREVLFPTGVSKSKQKAIMKAVTEVMRKLRASPAPVRTERA